ncbi:g8656 [Coccomyxa elongata]
MASNLVIDEQVDIPLLLECPTEALLPILRHLKGWNQAEEEDLEPWQISGAMTNIIFRCQNLVTNQFVLVRIFGTNDALFSRDAEQDIFRRVAQVGLGPKLLANFGNGRVEEFLQDQAITAADMRSRPIAFCVATAMACFNFSPLILSRDGVAPRPIIWDRLRSWASSVAKHYTPQQLSALGVHDVFGEIPLLEEALTANHSSLLGFCHNDLQYGNMLLHTASHRSLSMDSIGSYHSVERALRGSSPPPLGPSPTPCRRSGLQGTSPEPDGMSPRSRERLRTGLKGFAPSEMEPRTSDGELITDLLARAGAEFERKSSVSRAHAVGSSPSASSSASVHSPFQAGADGASPADDVAASQHLREHAERSGRAFGSERLSVRLIDYEYAGPNPVAFDIANHWCEYAADYHTDTPHLLDYSLMPDDQQQDRFVRAYMESALALQGGKGLLPSSSQEAALEDAVEQLKAAARAYLPISHLLWGLWGLIQAHTSNVPGFDFDSYAQQRLEQYVQLRGLALPNC